MIQGQVVIVALPQTPEGLFREDRMERALEKWRQDFAARFGWDVLLSLEDAELRCLLMGEC